MLRVVRTSGGEGGIRTLGTGVSPYNGLANRRIRPLCHLSGVPVYSLPRRTCLRVSGLQAQSYPLVVVSFVLSLVRCGCPERLLKKESQILSILVRVS